MTCYAVSKRTPITYQKSGTSLKFGPSQIPLSGPATDGPRGYFYTLTASHFETQPPPPLHWDAAPADFLLLRPIRKKRVFIIK